MDLRVTPLITLTSYLFPLCVSHFLTDFNATFTTVYPMHALQVQEYSDLSYHLQYKSPTT